MVGPLACIRQTRVEARIILARLLTEVFKVGPCLTKILVDRYAIGQIISQ
jgi:hypothetical protein